MTNGEGPGKVAAPRQHHRRATVLYALAACIASAYPLAVVVGANIATVPMSPGSIIRSLAASLGFAAALLLASRFVFRNASAGAAWSAVFLLIFGLYHLALGLGRPFSLDLSPEQPAVALVYTAAGVVAATLLTAPWRARPRDPVPALMAAVLFLGAAAGTGVWRRLGANDSWRQPAGAMIESALPLQGSGTVRPQRDVFYVVLDALGSADTLGNVYGVDLGPFVEFLKGKGFEVPGAARSNYGQTYLSLASTLNFGYLDAVAAAMGKDAVDRRALAYLIDHNALLTLARRSGYRVVGVGSDYLATTRIPAAEVCLCDRYGLDIVEQAVLYATPLSALPLSRWTYVAHQRKVLDAFDAIETLTSQSERLFVFAHVIAPHPPFVFMADGTPRESPLPFTFNDGDQFRQSDDDYLKGYGEQTQFVTRRLISIVETLLNRPGPPPAIVLHGDHGPGRTNMTERLGIFAAYYFPDSDVRLEDTVTPINLARALATTYLGVNLPPLADRSYFSEWNTPYDFTLVAR